jgi:protein-tyrosine-phosphatase
VDADTPEAFEIIVICSGNRFRSPLVAAYLREATKGLPVRVGSAGTLDLGAMPAMEGAVAAARELDLNLDDHLSRFVGKVRLDGADLVLGFERMHVATAVVEGNAKRERTFTLPELVSLLEAYEPPGASDPIARARLAIVQADRARGRNSTMQIPEIADPIGTSARAQRRTASELTDLAGRLVTELFGRPVESPEHASRRPWRERLRGRG